MEPVVMIITQARVGSTRLPGKLTLEVQEGTTLLDLHLQRVLKSKYSGNFTVATTFEPGVERLIEISKSNGVRHFQGNEHDVLDRFYQAASELVPDYVVRVTSDCPLLDYQLLDEVIEKTIASGADYGANIFNETFPDGQDVEVVSFKALEYAWKTAKTASDREHVTPFIRNNSKLKGGDLFTSFSLDWSESFNYVRMTVDEREDFKAIEVLTENCGIDKSWQEYTIFILENPELFRNQKILRNEGYLKSLKKDN